MKKRLILAALLSVGVLVGCGNKNSSETPVSSETPSSEAVSSEEISSETPSSEAVSSENTSSESNSSSSSEETPGTTVNYGTLENPLTPAQVAEICKDFTKDDYSKQKGYVTGVVKGTPDINDHGSYEFYLEGDVNFQVYSAKLGTNVSAPKAGDTVIVQGYFKKYYEKYEVAYISTLKDSPIIVSVVAGSNTPDTPDTPDTTTDGSLEEPLTIAELRTKTASLQQSDYNNRYYSEKVAYVTGLVTDVTMYNSNYDVTISDGTNEYLVYGGVVGSSASAPVKGDTIIASGYYVNFNGTYELTKKGDVAATINKVTHNSYSISYSVVNSQGIASTELATVSGLSANANSGSTQEFTITPSTGNVVSSVKVNNSPITANKTSGKYSFVVTSENVIVIEVVAEGTALPVTKSLNITANTGTLASNKLSISWAGEGFTVTNNKASSKTEIRTSDTGHFRVYAGSELVVSLTSGSEIKEVQVTCTSSDYAGALVTAATDANLTAIANGSVVTITGTTGTSATIACAAQVRLNKIVVTYIA